MNNNLANALWRIYEAFERSGIENRVAFAPTENNDAAFEAYKKNRRSMDFDCFIKMHPDLLAGLMQSIADENEQSITESLKNAIEKSIKQAAKNLK